ncbi:DNA-binding protein [Polaromonas sp. UBA4122]|uniref:helix-turn-helix domain-containing transcriptional regulator n=1 Tax=Polaromonas sp. UBA4122 TaxID=1947074 RepID=UPI0026BEB62E
MPTQAHSQTLTITDKGIGLSQQEAIEHLGIKELRADRQFAVAYLKAALEELDDPDNRAAGLLALRAVAEAYGGLGMVAAQAGISREALYRSLSPKGTAPQSARWNPLIDHGF